MSWDAAGWRDMAANFLEGVPARKGRWRDKSPADTEVKPQYYWTGQGRDALEVAYGTAPRRPTMETARKIWKKRHGRSAAPLLLVVGYPVEAPHSAIVCGAAGEQPLTAELAHEHAARIAATALRQPDRHAARSFIAKALQAQSSGPPGLINRGLLASHELEHGVPHRTDWAAATERARPLLGQENHDLIRGLGFTVESRGRHSVLRIDDEQARAVAVFLQPDEQPDLPSQRYDHQSPVTYALTQAERDNLPWVVSVHGSTLRLYSTSTAAAVGQRGRTETYVELYLPLLAPEQAGYLDLLFSARALAEGGTLAEIQRNSQEFTSALSDRLRERVYREVVPRLAVAVANAVGGTDTSDLAHHYETAMTILFRLLFVAYAEDSRLLPLDANGEYRERSLKRAAHWLADSINQGHDLGFDNPLTDAVEPAADRTQTDLWDRCLELFHAVDSGHRRWGVPAYNGGLFSRDPDVSPTGAAIDGLRLANADFGPALTALIVDRSPDEIVGPIDFRALSVREFGTIYEGLLESELSVADQALTVDRNGQFVPARDSDRAEVAAGAIYLHNRSGQRKATGSYFTKPFAVDHLVAGAVEVPLAEHLERVRERLDAGDAAGAAELFFDFRIADIAMGSGHFLTASIDRIEARMQAFLSEHPVAGVDTELDALRNEAAAGLGDIAGTVEIETSSLLRRLIARRCIYGVDHNPLAVELARVAIWIHTFVPGLPLSFLDHNLVLGDSLTGVATLSEAKEALIGDSPQKSYLDEPLEQALRASEQPLKRLANLTDSTPGQIADARQAAREANAAVEPLRALLDMVVARRIDDTIPPPTLEQADDLHKLVDAPERSQVADLRPLHFPVAFPEIFLRDRPGFDAIVGNPPWEEATVERLGFWALRFPGLKSLRQQAQRARLDDLEAEYPAIKAEYDREVGRMQRLRTLLTKGPYPGMGSGDPDLYKAFCWRFWHLARDDGGVGVVLPRSALSAAGTAPWRRAVFDEGTFDDVTFLTNSGGWVFDEAEHRYTIGLVTLRKGPRHVGALRLCGPYNSLAAYQRGITVAPATLARDDFLSWTNTASFPLIPSPKALDVFLRLRAQPRLDIDDGQWRVRPVAELHATNDRRHMIVAEERPDGAWPVYKGASFDLWNPDTGDYYAWAKPDYICDVLHQKRLRQQRHPRSAFRLFSEKWALDQSTLPCLHPRIAFRDVARATDSRTVRLALIPGQCPLTNKAPYFLWPKGDETDQAFLLGVLSSRPLDWYARRFVETNLNFHIVDAFPIPRPKREHPLRRVIVDTAGRLAAVDERFAGWAAAVGVPVGSVTNAQKPTYLARLDAAVALLYGLTRDELRTLYRTFHEGWDPGGWERAVLAEYDTLEAETQETAT